MLKAKDGNNLILDSHFDFNMDIFFKKSGKIKVNYDKFLFVLLHFSHWNALSIKKLEGGFLT